MSKFGANIFWVAITQGPQQFAKIIVIKVDNFVLPIFLLQIMISVGQIEWKKHPYLFFLLLVQN